MDDDLKALRTRLAYDEAHAVLAMLWSPIPYVMYHEDDRILWCNHAMLGCFFGLSTRPAFHAHGMVFGEPITKIFPEYLWRYVQRMNPQVINGRYQVEKNWSDEAWVDIKWDVHRYPVETDKCVAVLIPKDVANIATLHGNIMRIRRGGLDDVGGTGSQGH